MNVKSRFNHSFVAVIEIVIPAHMEQALTSGTASAWQYAWRVPAAVGLLLIYWITPNRLLGVRHK